MLRDPLPAIRRARAGDAEELASLGRETFVDTFVHDFGIPYPADDLERYLEAAYDVAKTRRRLLDPAEAWWVVERDGAIAGFANAGPNTLPHPEAQASHSELRRLYIGRKAQGAGLGKALLEVALAWMEVHTDGPLWIGVWSGNARAQRLYAGYGFEKVGEYKYSVGSFYDDELILRRPQGPGA